MSQIKTVCEYDPSVHSVALGLWFRVGSRDELAEEGGLSHFMEHMMFKGTKKRTPLAIASAFDAMGAESNAFTSKEYTCFYARMRDDDVEAAMEVLSDMVVNSQFPQDEINREREVVIEEIARGEDEPSDYIYDVFSKCIFPSHNLGKPIIGTRQLVGGFMHDNCIAYHDKHYHQANLVVAAAGNIQPERLQELADRYLAELPEGTQPNDRSAVTDEAPKLRQFVKKDTEQAHILYGMPGISADDDRRHAARLFETILAGPMSSRLFQEVREKRGLCYAIYASTAGFVHAGQFFIYTGTRPDNIGESLSVISAELKRFLKDGINQEEFERAREYALGHMVLSAESARAKMTRLGQVAVQGLPLHDLDWEMEQYRKVTPTDVMAVAASVLGQPATVCAISPLAEDEVATIVDQALA